MELFDEDRLICSVSGMNYCWISDVMLPKTDRNYYLANINTIITKNIVPVDFPGFCPYLTSISKTSVWIFDD